MTRSEFLKKLTSKVRKSRKHAHLYNNGKIRFTPGGQCPIEFLAGVPRGRVVLAIYKLGLHRYQRIIISAADRYFPPHNINIRPALLKACGLCNMELHGSSNGGTKK